MKSSKILIVGSGPWAQKVFSLITEKTNFQVGLTPAITFETSALSHLQSNDLIWIATKPAIQLEIISKIGKTGPKLIIEKPIFFEQESYKKLLETQIDLSRVWISEPWTYSNYWASAKTKIAQENNLGFKVSRGGPISRNYIPGWLDWCYHDLLLFFNLFPDRAENFKIENLRIENEILTGKIIDNNFSFDIKFGNFKTREAKWVSNKINLDFNAAGELHPVDHPILNMLLQILKLDENAHIYQQLNYLNKITGQLL